MNWTDFEVLREYIEKRVTEYSVIDENRKNSLKQLAEIIKEELISNNQVKLVFICTHNSRRSHLGHLWAQLAASFYRVEGFSGYSGGSEATAFNSRTVKALKDAGMHIVQLDDSSNPIFQVKFPDTGIRIQAFSKKYSDPPNPTMDFIAVMTCSEAEKACPVVYGAKSRFAIPYKDPKSSDGTPKEQASYADRCGQMAREMLFLFSMIH